MKFLRGLSKEKLQRFVLAILVALIVTGVVVQFYTLKELRELSECRDKIETLKTQLADAEAAVQAATQAEPVRKQIQAFIEAQDARMITGDPFAWAVRELTLVAEKHPVHILNWQLGTKGQHAKKSSYGTIAIRVDVSGRYDEIGHFLEDLENKFPSGQIRSLTLGGAQADTAVHQASLEFVLLVRPEKSAKPKTEKPS